MTAFDVGQGMALLVETAGHRLLYDTGPAYAPESDGGSRVILPYLRGRGIGRLDAMVVSHSDLDHAGGACRCWRSSTVGWVSSLAGTRPRDRAAQASRHRRCVAGQGWTWDGVRFEMLHPTPASYARPGLKPNARSCTLRGQRQRRAILLAGDIEAAQEALLLSSTPQRCAPTCCWRRTTAAAPRRRRPSCRRWAADRRIPGRVSQPLPPSEAGGGAALCDAPDQSPRSDRDGAISLAFAQSPFDRGYRR